MGFVRNFLRLSYYLSVLEGKASFKVFLAGLLLAFVISLKPSFTTVRIIYPLTSNLEAKVLSLVEEVYPQELEIKIEKGLATTNVTEPYYLVVRQSTLENYLSLTDDNAGSTTKIRLLAIDTKGKAEDFERYQALVLLTEKSLVYFQDGRINVQPLREMPQLTINREVMTNLIKELNQNNWLVVGVKFLVVIMPFFILLGAFLSLLFIWLFLAVIIWLMKRINQLNLGPGQIFRLTVAISFLPLLAWNLLDFLPFGLPFMPGEIFLNLFILGLAYLVLVEYKKRQN